MTPHAPEVPLAVTLLFSTLLLAMIVCLALERRLEARKSYITGAFAVLALILGSLLGVIPRESVTWAGHELHMPAFIPGIDWEVIVLILGVSLFVETTGRSGLFSWMAIRLTQLSRGDPLRLLGLYGILTVFFSAVLDNITAMIIVGSLTAVSLKRLRREENLLGFLMVEGLMTNIGGMLTLVSSVPNIIVGQAAGIGYVTFFLRSSPYVLLGVAVTLWLARWRFGIRRLADEEERELAMHRVSGLDERDDIESPAFFRFSALALVGLILGFATASFLPVARDLGLGFVAAFFALLTLFRYRHDVNRYYRMVDWDLLGFFASLFVVINVCEHAQVLRLLGSGLGRLVALGDSAGPACLLWATAVLSSLTDNIPLAAVLAKTIQGLPGSPSPDSPIWWSVIYGANIGGNLTPIGSASTVLAVTLMQKHGLPVSFMRFVRIALPFALVQLVLATVYLLLFL